MDAKHQFKYTYNETDIDYYSPHEITFEMPGSASLDQMLYNFQAYLKACGFVFNGELEIVDHTFDVMDELDGTLHEIDDADKALQNWNEGITRLDAEVKKNKWVHGMCNPPSPDWKKK